MTNPEYTTQSVVIIEDTSPSRAPIEKTDVKIMETDPVKRTKDNNQFDSKKFLSLATKFLRNIEVKSIPKSRKDMPNKSKKKRKLKALMNQDKGPFRDHNREQWELHLLQKAILTYARIKFTTAVLSSLREEPSASLKL